MNLQGKNKKVKVENGQFIVTEEQVFTSPEQDNLEIAIQSTEITQSEADDYVKKQAIFLLHQELHTIHNQVKNLKSRADEIKEQLGLLGVDTNKILTKPMPKKPKLNKKVEK